MPRHRVRVDAPAATVYAFIADARQRPTWLPELAETAGAPDRPLATGDRFVGYATLLGHRFVGASEVLEAEPGLRLEEEVVIGARFRTAWQITPAGENNGRPACEVVHRIDIEFPQGALGTLERWVLTRYLSRLQRKGLRRLAGRSAAN